MLRRAVRRRLRPLTALLAWLLAGQAQAGIGAPGVAVPVPGFSRPCDDPRYPALAGPWIVGCGSDGKVDRALSIRTGRELRLPLSFRQPALAEGLVIGVGREAAVIRLDEQGAEEVEDGLVRGRPTAPPVTDGERIAMTQEDDVSAWRIGESSRHLRPARPVGWMPPALAEGRLAWIEDAGEGRTELWWLPVGQPRPEAQRLAEDARLVVGSATHLAWVEGEQPVLLTVETGAVQRFDARTGFAGPLALWEDVLCWETRPTGTIVVEGGSVRDSEGQGVDIDCSDGLQADGPGHQRWPSRHGPWLLYRQEGKLWLRTAAQGDGDHTLGEHSGAHDADR